MSASGVFEIDPAGDADELLLRVREMGFPHAQLEKVEGFRKPYLIDLQAFSRPDAGRSDAVGDDLVRVARFLVEHARGSEVYYSQDLDIRDPGNTKVIQSEALRDYPPRMDGHEALFLVRR